VGEATHDEATGIRRRARTGADMGLTEEERRRLDGLADDLSREDPQLGRALSGGPLRRSRDWSPAVLASLLVTVSLVLVVLGVGLRQLWLFTAGSVTLISAGGIGVAAGYRSLRRWHGRS
jgi:hypothetical protein